MSEIIFHHYPLSPVAEKVRAAFGIKTLAWRSVEHNRLPDRPELFALWSPGWHRAMQRRASSTGPFKNGPWSNRNAPFPMRVTLLGSV